MNLRVRSFLVAFVVCLVVAVGANAQGRRETVEIREPGQIAISVLFKQSDVVADVKIVSGDTEHYDRSVCKGEVLTGWKGRKTGEELYFGGCNGQRLGLESIVFLKKSEGELTPTRGNTGSSYGKIRPIFDVQHQGYGAMAVSYVCVFPGKEIADQCGDGVRICTDYIVPPDLLATFPAKTEQTDFGCRWVNKSRFLELMDNLREQVEMHGQER